jgi:prepilin-type N-terminal cleavage/methylation domain-containing protein
MRSIYPVSTRRGGFSLIELAATIAVFGIVAGMGLGILVEGGRIYSRLQAQSEGFAAAEYALKRFRLELCNLSAPTEITEMDGDSITFRIGGDARTFEKSGSNLVRGSKVLAGNVTDFDLTYYAADGSIASAPGQVHRIAAAITVNCAGTPVSMRTEVFPRALRDTYATWQEE